ncbi:MAG TPA: hypothetical protein VIL74_07805 [Pyrinomonadaceae bacterium]|jgi:hypothetical protein
MGESFSEEEMERGFYGFSRIYLDWFYKDQREHVLILAHPRSIFFRNIIFAALFPISVLASTIKAAGILFRIRFRQSALKNHRISLFFRFGTLIA